MLISILLVVHIIVAIALGAVVLLQRSEGGALGMGGGPSGFMTARGAGDLLTRTTWILGGVFFVLSFVLTILAGRAAGGGSLLDRLNVQGIDVTSQAPRAPASANPGTTAPPGTNPQPQLSAPAVTAGTAQAQAQGQLPVAPVGPLQAPRPTVQTAAPVPARPAPAAATAPAPAVRTTPANPVRNADPRPAAAVPAPSTAATAPPSSSRTPAAPAATTPAPAPAPAAETPAPAAPTP